MSTSSRTAVKVSRLRAIGLTVTDVDRSRDFYSQALGFQAIGDITVTNPDYSTLEGIADTLRRIVTLQLGGERVELVQYLNRVGQPIPLDSRSNDLWFQHMAIVVSDMDRAYAHLQPYVSDPISPAPQTIPLANPGAGGVRAFKFKDPDRHDLELIWFPPDKRKPRWHQPSDRLFLGIDHSAIVVADTEHSLRFYRDGLGLALDGGSFNWRETQARLDNLPGAAVRVTSLGTVNQGAGIELLDYLVPPKGRPIPGDWQSYDIAHMQLELVVNDVTAAVEQVLAQGGQVVSPRLVEFRDRDSPYHQGCLVKDPTGHALLLIALSQD